MNKKAQVFEKGFVLAVFIICSAALFSFLIYNRSTGDSFGRLYQAFSIYDTQEDNALYVKEAGKLAIQEAYFKTLGEMGRECPESENPKSHIWRQDCMLKNAQLKEIFMDNLNSSMNALLSKEYWPSISLSEDNLSFRFKPSVLNASLKEANIKISYTSDISFDINISEYNLDLDFEKIYSPVLEKWGICRKEDTYKVVQEASTTKTINPAKECMLVLEFDSWNLYVNQLFFSELRSKKNYYINGNLEPLVIKFKLE